jgi:hypothetical protein
MLAAGNIAGFIPAKDSQKQTPLASKLRFQFVSENQFALVVRGDRTTIRIAKVRDFTPAQYTIEMHGIEAVVRWLAKLGVTCEKYPFVQDRELGIWTCTRAEDSRPAC